MLHVRAPWLGGGEGAGAPAAAADAGGENVPANACEPQPPPPQQQPTKRARLDDVSAAADLSREALVAWLGQAGPASGPQLEARFCGGGGGSAPLTALLEQLCAEFVVVRRGAGAARSGRVDLADPTITFMLL